MPAPADDADDVFAVTVTFRMTPKQRREYASNYGLAAGPLLADEIRAAARVVPDDVRDDLASRVSALIGEDYRLQAFTSWSVSQPS
jgi:hypothetical protein